MVANLNPKLTAFEAQAAANGFLLDNLPDHYLAIEPRLEPNRQVWRVSVVLTYPYIGSIGEVGEVRVSTFPNRFFLLRRQPKCVHEVVNSTSKIMPPSKPPF